MAPRSEDRSRGGTEPVDLNAPLTAADFSELLSLLAFAREQAERFRSEQAEAEQRALRGAAEVETLRFEIDRMTDTLIGLQAQFDAVQAARHSADSQLTELNREHLTAVEWAHNTIGELQESVLQLTASNQRLTAELEDLRTSTSWRVTAPVRAASRLAAKGRGPGGTRADES